MVMHVCLVGLLLLSACLVSCQERQESKEEGVLAETAKEALSEAVFQANMGLADCEADEKLPSRKKRSVFSNNYGYGYGYPYGGHAYPYNPWSYLPLPDFTLYPGLIRTSAFNLPSQRFFSTFSTPARIVRSASGALTRYYYKTGTYQQAYNDFLGLPLINRQLVTQSQTVQTSAAQSIVYNAVSRSYPRYSFQLCNNCCYNNNPCITSYLDGDMFPERRVTRNYIYLG